MDKNLDAFKRMEKLRKKYPHTYWTSRSPEGRNLTWTVMVMYPRKKFNALACGNTFHETAKLARIKFRAKIKEMKNG